MRSPASTPRSAGPAVPPQYPPPRRRGPCGRLTGFRGSGCSCSGHARWPALPKPAATGFAAAAPRRAGAALLTTTRGGGGGLTSRAAASQRARARGPSRRPQCGRSSGEQAGPRRRTGCSIGRGGGASGRAGQWGRGGAGRG